MLINGKDPLNIMAIAVKMCRLYGFGTMFKNWRRGSWEIYCIILLVL